MVPTRKLDRVSPTSQETLVLRLFFRRERETKSGLESILEKSVVSCPERIPLVLLGLKIQNECFATNTQNLREDTHSSSTFEIRHSQRPNLGDYVVGDTPTYNLGAKVYYII